MPIRRLKLLTDIDLNESELALFNKHDVSKQRMESGEEETWAKENGFTTFNKLGVCAYVRLQDCRYSFTDAHRVWVSMPESSILETMHSRQKLTNDKLYLFAHWLRGNLNHLKTQEEVWQLYDVACDHGYDWTLC